MPNPSIFAISARVSPIPKYSSYSGVPALIPNSFKSFPLPRSLSSMLGCVFVVVKNPIPASGFLTSAIIVFVIGPCISSPGIVNASCAGSSKKRIGSGASAAISTGSNDFVIGSNLFHPPPVILFALSTVIGSKY